MPNRSPEFAEQTKLLRKQIGVTRRELALLLPKMRVHGIITGHDVTGCHDLQAVFREFGGSLLEFPWLYSSGGIGFWQRGIHGPA